MGKVNLIEVEAMAIRVAKWLANRTEVEPAEWHVMGSHGVDAELTRTSFGYELKHTSCNHEVAIAFDKRPWYRKDYKPSLDDPIAVLTREKHVDTKLGFLNRLLLPKRRHFIGVIWFSSNEKWHFNFYGKNYKELIIQLCERLAKDFDVDIDVQLKQNEPKWETSLEEWERSYY